MSTETAAELQDWFSKAEKPQMPIKLYPGVQILDYEKFLHTQFTIIKSAKDVRIIEPSISRLRDLKELMSKTYADEG